MLFSRTSVLRLLFLLLLVAHLALGQETTGGIQGTVKDPTGAVISNATVELTGSAQLGAQKVVTDSSGVYKFSNLPSGTYNLSVSASGFKSAKFTGLEIRAGRLPIIDAQLQLGGVSETVEVSSAAPMVDVTQSKVQVTVEHSQMQNMPVGRSFQSVIPFAPGARAEPLQGGARNDRGTGRENGFQIDGATDSENVYMIDGINTTDLARGGVGRNFQADFVQEVQIKSSSFEAEYGGAIGGVVNAIPKRGSNGWHGSVLTYFRSTALNANDLCGAGYTTNSGLGGSTGSTGATGLNCGLRANPSISSHGRFDAPAERYIPEPDKRHTIEPGFEIGGPIFKDRLWLFTSYIPQLDTIDRTTTFTGKNAGKRTLSQTYNQHNAYTRLDYKLANSVRLYAGWNYGYAKQSGTLGTPDSILGQVNTGASNDPATLRADRGILKPQSVYTWGGDWTPTSKLVVNARFGYFFSNTEDRGTDEGTQWQYNNTLNATTKDITGLASVPNGAVTSGAFSAPLYQPGGFSNIPSGTFKTFHDAFKRKSMNIDGSYFVGKFAGTHTLKGGFFWQSQFNDVLTGYNQSYTYINWGNTPYAPVTGTTVCNNIIAQNIAAGLIDPTLSLGQQPCIGKYGYFVVSDGVDNTGTDRQTAKALYIQDAWTVGHGLTLNLGIRFDNENQPPFNPRFPTVHFGFGDKIAPRIGGAYDLFRNGKVKIYASYGQFYDIMKMGLARGSFGSDYWHDCVYALDTTNYVSILPASPVISVNGGSPAPHACQPGSGPAAGVPTTAGLYRFIENVDWRATKGDPRDPAISPSMKPMKQHEIVAGVDWAITPNWSLETRYSRKRLDRTIEDMSITDNLGYYIGNPGTAFADVLHRKVNLIDSTSATYLTGPLEGPLCANCPPVVPAIRRYDGLEFRLAKRTTGNWFGAVSYTYSKLSGNYAGLTNTDPTDANGGRHDPNNGRAFDLPTMTYIPSGKIDDGPLSTDRPHTGKVYGYYRLRWFGQETLFGFVQSAFQGTPISSCLPVAGSSSACQWAEGRGNFVNFVQNATTGVISVDHITHGARSSPYFQSDLSVKQEFTPSKAHEGYRISFEANIFNVLNQRAPVGFYQFVIPTALINPARDPQSANDPGVDWARVMNGYNYVDALNGTGAFAGKTAGGTTIQSPLRLASRLGQPNLFQQARNMRLAVRFTF